MDDNQYQSSQHYGQQLCTNCNEYPALEGHPTPLCDNCRKAYIKYPIPRWIFGFSGIILLVMVFSLYRMPPYLRLAMDLGKAQKAIEARKYVTAENILNKVITEFPRQQEPKAYMFIAACYNLNFDQAVKTEEDLRGFLNNFEETQNETGKAIHFFSTVFFVKDSTIQDRIDAASADSVAGLMKLLKQVDSTTDQYRLSSKYFIADKLFDMKQYEACKSVLSYIVKEEPEHFLALSLLAATNRRMKNFDEAIGNCDAMLQVNKEQVVAFTQKVKIELARKDLKKATVYLAQAQAINPNYLGVTEARALVAYFNGKKDEANELLKLIGKQEENDSEKTIFNRTTNILNGTEVYN